MTSQTTITKALLCTLGLVALACAEDSESSSLPDGGAAASPDAGTHDYSAGEIEESEGESSSADDALDDGEPMAQGPDDPARLGDDGERDDSAALVVFDAGGDPSASNEDEGSDDLISGGEADAGTGEADEDGGLPQANQGAEAPTEAGASTSVDEGECVDGAACSLDSGEQGLCLAQSCELCVDVVDDELCVEVYGEGVLCVGGACASGDCHDSSECADGLLCGIEVANLCGSCVQDADCSEDPAHGAGTLCSAGACVVGDCHTSSDCDSGQSCGLSQANTCGGCADHTDCTADSAYGPGHLCIDAACVGAECADSSDCGDGTLCSVEEPNTCDACTDDAECVADAAHGEGTLCVEGACMPADCHTSEDCSEGELCGVEASNYCGACSEDVECTADASHGDGSLCAEGACVLGDCHDTSACTDGELCGVTMANTCGPCTEDADCRGDEEFGLGTICLEGECNFGECHNNSIECAGRICGAETPLFCGECTSDAQCQADEVFGENTICHTEEGDVDTGDCVSRFCAVSNQACEANGADFCCSNSCVPGNCCSDDDCINNSDFGLGFLCLSNSCTACDAPTGNTYYVDPVDGDDTLASGSGRAGGQPTSGCAFRTVARALQVIGPNPPVNLTVMIVGTSESTTDLDVAGAGGTPEALPILVPARVTLRTSGGAIRLPLDSTQVGVGFSGNGGAIAGSAQAPFIIDGQELSSYGIYVDDAGAVGNIAHVQVVDTANSGIRVVAGRLDIAEGVTVDGAGSTDATNLRRDGLLVSGSGHATIDVGPGQAPTTFSNNSYAGVRVLDEAVLEVAGIPTLPPDGTGTVVSTNNNLANLWVQHDSDDVAEQSSIDGLVAWGALQYGMRVHAGSLVKVRNTVSLANIQNGLRIQGGTNPVNQDVTTIDLGTAIDLGNNVFQSMPGSNQNARVGLCVAVQADPPEQTLAARGNLFANRDCRDADPGAITVIGGCGSYGDVGVASNNADITVDFSNCE